MKFHIHAQDTLETLQRSFNRAFPYLKLEFFIKPHEKGRPSEKHFMMNTKRRVDSCNPQLIETTVSVPTAMTVQELEALFSERLGLYIQVFRKSGNVWLETTATDDWSLFKQNMEGKELSEAPAIKPDELPDYHEQP